MPSTVMVWEWIWPVSCWVTAGSLAAYYLAPCPTTQAQFVLSSRADAEPAAPVELARADRSRDLLAHSSSTAFSFFKGLWWRTVICSLPKPWCSLAWRSKPAFRLFFLILLSSFICVTGDRFSLYSQRRVCFGAVITSLQNKHRFKKNEKWQCFLSFILFSRWCVCVCNYYKIQRAVSYFWKYRIRLAEAFIMVSLCV